MKTRRAKARRAATGRPAGLGAVPAAAMFAAALLAAALLLPGEAEAHRCDRTDNDRAEATRVLTGLTREIDAMERAIIEALRLQTGQLSGYIAQSAKAVTGALDSQTKLQAQIAREAAETEAMRARRPSASACEAVTGLTGLAGTHAAAESARERAARAEAGRISGDRAVVDRPGAAAGDAARFETVTRVYCNAARAGEESGLCRGADALHGADLQAATLFDRRTFAGEDELRAAVELSRNLAAPVVHDPPPLSSADTDRERRRVLLARSADARAALAADYLAQAPRAPRPGRGAGRLGRRDRAGLRTRSGHAGQRLRVAGAAGRPPLRGPRLVRGPPGDVPGKPAARAGGHAGGLADARLGSATAPTSGAAPSTPPRSRSASKRCAACPASRTRRQARTEAMRPFRFLFAPELGRPLAEAVGSAAALLRGLEGAWRARPGGRENAAGNRAVMQNGCEGKAPGAAGMGRAAGAGPRSEGTRSGSGLLLLLAVPALAGLALAAVPPPEPAFGQSIDRGLFADTDSATRDVLSFLGGLGQARPSAVGDMLFAFNAGVWCWRASCWSGTPPPAPWTPRARGASASAPGRSSASSRRSP